MPGKISVSIDNAQGGTKKFIGDMGLIVSVDKENGNHIATLDKNEEIDDFDYVAIARVVFEKCIETIDSDLCMEMFATIFKDNFEKIDELKRKEREENN